MLPVVISVGRRRTADNRAKRISIFADWRKYNGRVKIKAVRPAIPPDVLL